MAKRINIFSSYYTVYEIRILMVYVRRKKFYRCGIILYFTGVEIFRNPFLTTSPPPSLSRYIIYYIRQKNLYYKIRKYNCDS